MFLTIFGINEHRDCLSWVDFAVDHFGPDVKIVLTGISMGASTVLMAAGHGLVYVVDNDGYFNAVADFFTENSVPTEIVSKVL